MTAITKIICFQCAVPFWVSESHHDNLYKNGTAFWCPNGHEQVFTHKETCEEKIKALKKDRDWYSDLWEKSLIDSKNNANTAKAYKGHLTRLKNIEKITK